MAHADQLPDETAFGTLTLAVKDLPRSLAFYRDLLGLEPLETSETRAVLGVDAPILRLETNPDALRQPAYSTGLYHLAILFPDRRSLAEAVARLVRSGYPLRGASDHNVSEAFYLDDPDGNGLELYRDRPRSEWRFQDGRIVMTTDPIDEAGVFGALTPNEPMPERAPEGTRLGHVHLRVDDLGKAAAFYGGVLGFDEMARLPSALFMSAGGYHHHFGFNTWQSAGAPRPPENAVGLRGFTLTLPQDGIEALKGRLEQHGVGFQSEEDGFVFHDPWGHEVGVWGTGFRGWG